MKWRIGLSLLASVGSLACASNAGGDRDAMQEDEPVVLEAVVAGGPVSDSVPPIALWRARALTAWGDGIVVVDNGNDRLVLLDRELRVLRTIGATGAGPGEFEQPVSAQVSGDALLVAELGNRRFTEIDARGQVLRVWPSEYAGMSFAADAGGRIYAPSRAGSHYLVRIAGDDAEPFGARPEPAAVDTTGLTVGAPDPRIAVTAGDTVHVLDDENGVLYTYAPDGGLQSRSRLPVALLDSLIEQRDATVAQFGGPGSVAVSLTKDVSTTTDGRLLVLLTLERTGGVLIDPRTYRVRRVIVPDDGPAWNWLLRASDALFDDPLLYVLAADSLIVYRTRVGERQ
jgi:hypothetical protein